jgi:isopentenyl-diphosphate delta-isomerase
MSIPPERVVLLNDDGTPCGVAPKDEVHHDRTPLHLAFSCHVLDGSGRLLLTRRALSKATWPGIWTNAFCGHPEPFEPIPDAVTRRGMQELGMALTDVRLALPDFRYRAVDASGTVENEVCPVYTARAIGEPIPVASEVMDLRWVEPGDLAAALTAAPWAFSPWLVSQAADLSDADGAIDADAWQKAAA